MKTLQILFTLLLIGILTLGNTDTMHAQQYDLLLKGGHVIDPKNGIDALMDVAIKDDLVARVAKNISAAEAGQVVDAKGLYITPGLIDLHGHHFYGTESSSYLSDGFAALPPDGFTLRSGVTTVIDLGGAGWRNYDQFKEQVINRSRTRVLSFLNIVGHGMKGGAIEQNVADMDPKMTALVARSNPEVVGIKIAHYRGYNWEPHRRAAKSGRLAGIPVAIDLGSSDVPLPLDTLFFDIYRPGDMLTHMYGSPNVGSGFKEAAVDEEGVLRPHWLEAQQKGFIFDVGHGGGSFFYDVAVPATQQGLWPNTISTDLHTGSMNGGMKTMVNVMSKILNLGMPLQQVIEASTWKPARVIQREDLGHMSEGAVADIAVFDLLEGDFGFMDVRRWTVPGDEKLETELTIRAGQVVYDLNGIAGRKWIE